MGVEFLGLSLISLFSIVFNSFFIWYGAFLGLILHYVLIHILLCIRFKGYVPGVITSAIFLIPSIWILREANMILNYRIGTILLACLLGVVLMYIFFQVLYKLMGYWSELLYKHSKTGLS
ncbi:HXXEE domain-containing protein [Geosporobacter ferrireducens]|uniref:HXXEE domain-containing protein n=1 Tax=Geosporobacter ferrireducens TaxID=1424294 RepID=UPI0038BBC8D4